MTKKRIVRAALLLIASALLLGLVWLESGLYPLTLRAEVKRLARRYMLSDTVPERHSGEHDYVYNAGENVLFVSFYSTYVQEKQEGCALIPDSSNSLYKDMDLREPFYFSAYCDDPTAARAELELHLASETDDKVMAFDRTYRGEAKVKNGVAYIAINPEAQEKADDERWNSPTLGFSDMDAYLEYCAITNLQRWRNLVGMRGHRATADLRFYDSSGSLVAETVFEFE